MGTLRLLVFWDPEIDGDFRHRFERALDDLRIDHDDANTVDSDEDAPATARVVMAAASSPGAAPRDPDATVIIGGPGTAQAAPGSFRLESIDIDQRSRRWLSAAERLGARTGRSGLGKYAAMNGDTQELREWAIAFPADPLAADAGIGLLPEVLQAKLAEMQVRAETAERALANLERQHADAVRGARQSDQATAAARAESANRQKEIDALTATIESTAFNLSSVSATERDAVRAAREHVWRARVVAAAAAEAAAIHPDALAWPKSGAIYSGETLNGAPHGLGLMIFRNGNNEVASYRGTFQEGRRSGHGVAISDEGHCWSGEWAEDEACGFGLLEGPDGGRFEGQVAPDEQGDGAPRQVRGWSWITGRPERATPVHTPFALLLPSPDVRITRR